jgi:hypothetical protein
MMKKIEDLNYYELLEVSPQATSQEIHRAYERIRRVYEPNSVALYSLFSQEETTAISQRIEDAYRTLVYEDNRKNYDAMLWGERPVKPQMPPPPKYQPWAAQPTLTLPSENRYAGTPQSPDTQAAPANTSPERATPVSQFIAEYTGPAIKMLREQNGLTLRNVADRTKLGTRYLECIEEEIFQKLPARAYVRGFLMLYAKALGCDPEKMAGDYLKRYDAATAVTKPVKK